MSVLITGGTGKTGRRLAAELGHRGVGYRQACRHPDEAESGCFFDWGDRATWEEALKGASGLYVVPRPGGEGRELIDLIELAAAKGCRRVVLLSASLMPAGGAGPGEAHQWLSEHPSLDWAVLRPSWFMENFTEGPHRETVLEEGRLYSATEEGRVAFISAQDIAAVAAAVFTAPEAPNRDLVLTGPKALSYGAAAQVIAAQIGRPVRHVHLSCDELVERHLAHGLPPVLANLLGTMDRMIAGGAEDRITGEVAAVAGKTPVTFERFCQTNTEVWTSALTRG